MNFAELVHRQRCFYQTGATLPLAFRREQLQQLARALARHETSLLAALGKDLGKSPFQGYTTELGLVHAEIRHTLRNLPRWTRAQRGRTPWLVAPARGWVQLEPLGVALILGPWNYPAQLLLAPLVSAIAAGNCVMLKPSELAPNTAAAIESLVEDAFPDRFVAVAAGAAEVAEALLHERFDKIFFTGSSRVGRLVMAAAARHLTPVTLELGGKCPAIVCADAAVALAAKRIAWGKFMNAGQTCVAPDFLLVHRRIYDPFLAALQASVHRFYGEDAARSSDYGRIVNSRHFVRLVSYLQDGKIAFGGQHDAQSLFLAPTILTEVLPDAPVMQEEIFGPILPVLTFDHWDDMVKLLRNRPTPLAAYLFTQDRATEARLVAEVRSGGICVNDVFSHMIGSGLPFGGQGESGMGNYHGQAGFETFSHARAVLRRSTWLDLPFRYPPQRLSLAGVKRALRLLLGS